MAQAPDKETGLIRRVRVTVLGAVQGVGFRPFVHRLAAELGLAGRVRNSHRGVAIEVEGDKARLDEFLLRLERDRPPRAFIQGLEFSFLDPRGISGFAIEESSGEGAATTLVLPDIATCPDCLAEILDPADRRFRYPFTNCTNCGPRYTIIESLPYDRGRTTMAGFAMCPDCRREYEDPSDRRFHAQPNACPACGPRLALLDAGGGLLAEGDPALSGAGDAIRAGKVVAVKALGGFQLMVDARSADAVERLRARKRREAKPLALMFAEVDAVREACELSPLEERLLASPEAPIVLLCRRPGQRAVAAGAVAPGNPQLGAMLPSTPLHHLLLRDLGFPVVATSGNVTDEPICTGEAEALARLEGIADRFLVHDRPIRRHADDSVARVVLGREQVLRRARGYAPLPVGDVDGGRGLLAVGAHLKNSIALATGAGIVLGPHVGDLDSAPAAALFRLQAEELPGLFGTRVTELACDMHPDYHSTGYAARTGLPCLTVQHHHAHVLAGMAENDLEGPVLGVSWDGTGHGPDGTVWGGEFLLCRDAGFKRFAALRRFRLPGGEAAVREPRRSALGLLHELHGSSLAGRHDLAPPAAFEAADLALLLDLLDKGLHSPWTTSAGRLFDAAASLAGLRQRLRFEGQAAMELEYAFDEGADGSYPVEVARAPAGEADGPWAPAWTVDWGPMIAALVRDAAGGATVGAISARFHRGLAGAVAAVAERCGVERVMLTGGCFQNRRLTELAAARLETAGFRPYWHQRVPPNDGGIALGQAVAAVRARTETKGAC